jgi:hypothetical protein
MEIGKNKGTIAGRFSARGLRAASWPSSAFGRAGHCQSMHGGAPRRGHRAQRDRGVAAPTGGMDDKVRGGDWFELVETMGEASSMEEGVESHRGGTTPVGWLVRMVTAVFPRRRCAPVVGGGSGRHLQHRRGKGEVRGKTIWPEMD